LWPPFCSIYNEPMKSPKNNRELLEFLKDSPTPFHATANLKKTLQEAGFTALEESEIWRLEEGKSYYVTRNESSIIAFQLAPEDFSATGFAMVGAHTDSPCLRLKPQPLQKNENSLQLGTEVYGGALLYTWFDRDLSLAGRVSYENKKGEIKSTLMDFQRPLAIVPSLAIHLFRDVHQNRSLNPQKELVPVLMQYSSKQGFVDFNSLILAELQSLDPDAQKVFGHEFYCYDTQDPSILGYHNDFLTSARLDNLLSCWVGLQALLGAHPGKNILLVCNDHEEVGSQTAIGASGSFLKDTLNRITGSPEAMTRAMSRSILVSTDNAHGIHPNSPEKHDAAHRPVLNEGPALKVNANQRYATNSETAAILSRLADQNEIPLQHFVSRSDFPCGSTIGPLTASQIGIKTVDLGIPTWAMHSIREVAGTRDVQFLFTLLREFYSQE
jgi:aspartyl aminopeptidase